ncbi:glycosyltransferase family 2 protein [Thermosynechococcus sp. PP45]|uniref:2'-O-glycosyltransferase CruG n=1 Tax=unclassified Thermosynechococcus TaxID=2622553 RepID=UPI002672F2CE|nr:glycosyltransferase family 2 protein [Thermosynechococcus sp. PP45]WNC23622.1 glycosyltransferase family 2 protein [Thermosynechococcus sp. PP551]WNC26198.1 glycosyltransferase family 2 protein [Thermosynechococcus sp. PP555]
MSTVAVGIAAIASAAILAQAPWAAVLIARLGSGWRRPTPLTPQPSRPENLAKVSIVVPTLNEAQRLQPCLEGLMRQGYEVREILIVDSHSQDGTAEIVHAAQHRDPRLRLEFDPPLPPGWVGRPWALHTGFCRAHPDSEWILGIDADTQPQPGLVASLLATAEQEQLDLISLSPRFILKTGGEWWLQPALLLTLIYRFGAARAVETQPKRILANGQCLLIRRSRLEAMGGYQVAASSFCDDVTLVRAAAARGARVAFRDGSKVLKVRMYEGMAETWREWGRSLDLKDATPAAQLWGDAYFLWAVQGLPLPLLILGLMALAMTTPTLPLEMATLLNGLLVLIRCGMTLAIAPVYDWQTGQGHWLFWLSPLADPLAALRITLSSWQRPKQWRGRIYPAKTQTLV